MAVLESGSPSKNNNDREGEQESDPYSIRIFNFFSSIPTNEDLRRYYFWEAKRIGERERARLAEKKRTRRLVKLWKARWFGKLELKAGKASPWEWVEIFAIIQGHRFIYWRSEADFDSGENPYGQMYFAG